MTRPWAPSMGAVTRLTTGRESRMRASQSGVHYMAITWTFRRHMHRLLYESFRQAQGNQVLQVHFLQCYIRLMKERAVEFDGGVRYDLSPKTMPRELPKWHLDIQNSLQVSAQFQFCGGNLWDIRW